MVGATIVLAILCKAILDRLAIPPLIGFMALGFVLRLSAVQWGLFSEEMRGVYAFLSDIGIICLLFRVGLECHISVLIRQLKKASLIWVGNIVISGALGYVLAYYVLNLGLLTSLVLGTALTATSVGVSVGTWQDTHAIQSGNGALLLDVAELDDISGIVLMGVLFTVLHVLQNDTNASLLSVSLVTLFVFLGKLFVFAGCCMVFSRFVEAPMTQFFQRLGSPPDDMLLVAGVAFMITALAGILGFSIAIGAFFAGLVFSRDPQAVHIEASFSSIYDLFTPFFFVGIGLHIDPTTLTSALGLGIPLLLVAILGKVIGTSLPAMLTVDRASAVLLGVSMVPRAEIAMVIMQSGLSLGAGAVSPNVFSAMTVVSAVTCIITPFTVHALIKRWPHTVQEVG